MVKIGLPFCTALFLYICVLKPKIMELTIKFDQRKKEVKALIKYLNSLPYIELENKQELEKVNELTPSQKKWINDLKNSIQETKEVVSGKREKQTLKSFLDEI